MTATMSSKERVMASFAHKPVDRVPIWQTDGNVWIIDNAGISFADMLAMDDLGVDLAIQAFERMHTDMVTVGAGAWLGWLNAFGCSVKMDKIGVSMEVDTCIKDPDKDIPKLEIAQIKDRIAENELCQKILRQTRLFKDRIGNDKAIQFVTGGPFTMANVMAGTENFMMLLAEENNNVSLLLEFTAAAVAEMCNQITEAGCDVIFTAEPNASCTMISQSMYESVVVPCTEKYLAQIHGSQFHCMHICGQSTSRIPNIMELGFDGMSVDAIVDMKTAMDTTSKRMSMMGSISPVDALLNGTAEEVYAQSLEYARYAGLESGFFLMPGCDVCPKTPLENIDAMYRAACDAALELKEG